MQQALSRFLTGARVEVVESKGVRLHAPGTVARVRSDGSAFVALDQRSKVDAVHPFPPGGARATHVVVDPSECRPLARTRGQKRRASRLAAQPRPTVETWGKDHWSTFAYVETCVVDRGGAIDRQRMRTHPGRHPLLAHMDGSAYPTRLRDGALLSDHDDWDCLSDLEEAGLLENIGSDTNHLIILTDEGRRVAAALRAHKAAGGTFASFAPPPKS